MKAKWREKALNPHRWKFDLNFRILVPNNPLASMPPEKMPAMPEPLSLRRELFLYDCWVVYLLLTPLQFQVHEVPFLPQRGELCAVLVLQEAAWDAGGVAGFVNLGGAEAQGDTRAEINSGGETMVRISLEAIMP